MAEEQMQPEVEQAEETKPAPKSKAQIKWEKAVKDIRGIHFEEFEERWEAAEEETGMQEGSNKPNRRQGNVIRWAIEAGWFGDDLTEEQLDNMLPVERFPIYKAIVSKYTELTTFDPN